VHKVILAIREHQHRLLLLLLLPLLLLLQDIIQPLAHC
jgi:hypothetical protein